MASPDRISFNPGALWEWFQRGKLAGAGRSGEGKILGVLQQPLALILLQKCRDTNGRHIVIQVRGAYVAFNGNSTSKRAYFCKNIVTQMGGVQRCFFGPGQKGSNANGVGRIPDFNRILLFSAVGVHLAPLKTHAFKGF